MGHALWLLTKNNKLNLLTMAWRWGRHSKIMWLVVYVLHHTAFSLFYLSLLQDMCPVASCSPLPQSELPLQKGSTAWFILRCKWPLKLKELSLRGKSEVGGLIYYNVSFMRTGLISFLLIAPIMICNMCSITTAIIVTNIYWVFTMWQEFYCKLPLLIFITAAWNR